MTRDVMRLLVRKELGDVARRRGLRMRPWAIEWDDSAVEALLQTGFDPQFGARPLKRAIEERVLVPLARAIVQRDLPQGDQFLLVRAPDRSRIEVQFIDPDVPGAEAAVDKPGQPDRRDVRAIAAEPTGSAAEAAVLHESFEHLAERIRSEAWQQRKRELLEQVSSGDDFWNSSERFSVLAAIEYIDRLEAGFATAESLLRRLDSSFSRSDVGSVRLAGLLAQRLYLVERALSGLDADDPLDAFIEVRPGSADDRAISFATRLIDMYRTWADRRGMHVESVDAPSSPEPGSATFAVSGFAAYSILRDEAGLHVWEWPSGQRSFSRLSVRVSVAPRPVEPAEQRPGGLTAQVADAFAAIDTPAAVVRRYRNEPSPLVRDSVRGWRTGRLDRVLAGDFDLL
ncbi:MAG TPA: PCRF domain-containing protein [Candidatus Caenarcaniphilales bacterium]|nr:PCRF domain-containing protein [Candidatus Caenarcaniphilales bacterium]